jgi:peptidyl-prolyl cis-trans isomerase C
MKHPLTLFATLLLLGSASIAQAADETPPAADKPVAVVNGHQIPQLYFEMLKRDLLAQGQHDDNRLDAKVKDSLIILELASRAAVDKGLDKNPSLAAMLDIRRKDLLAKAYLEDYVKAHPVTDAEITSEYDKAKASTSGNEYKVQHILVKTEAEADKILAELKRKRNFEELARKDSIDPGSAKKGGELGWNAPNAFVKEFADALSEMKKGETSKTPVKSEFGWHIIRVEDVRPAQIPPLEEVKEEITHQIQQARIHEALQALRKDAKIE